MKIEDKPNVIEYTEAMGPYDYPAELRAKTEGLPIGDQVRYLCVNVEDYRNDKLRGGHRSLRDALYFGGVVVDHGLVVGIYRTSGCIRISLLGKTQMVYSAVETDGAGEDSLDSFETVTYSLEPVWDPYYSLYTVPEDVTVLTSDVLPAAEGYVIGPTVRAIAEEAFPADTRLYYRGAVEGWLAITGKQNLDISVRLLDEEGEIREQVTIPDGMTEVPSYAFHCCRDLHRVDLPASVTSIGEKAFAAVDLSSIGYHGTPDKWLALKGKKNIGLSVYLYFEDDKPVKSVTIPASVTEVPAYAFDGCVQLTEIVLHDGVTAIGDYAFSGTSIASIRLPDGLTCLSDGLFSACEHLAALDIPQGVRSIGDYALSGTGIGELHLPAAVRTIGRCAFSTKKLHALHVYAMPSSCGRDMLGPDFSARDMAVYFHGSVAEWLQPCEGREFFLGRVVFDDGVIAGGVLRVPEGVTEIEAHTFAGVAGVTTVLLPSTVRVIGDYAFRRMHDLQVVDLASVEEIGAFAFCQCPALADVRPSQRLASIGKFAFSGCKALRRFYLPASVRHVEFGAFSDNARKLVVRCAAQARPDGWDEKWDIKEYDLDTYVTVEWGATE